MKAPFRAFVAVVISLAIAGLMKDPVIAAPTLLTLAQAQSMALTAHPDLRAADFDTQAAYEAVNIARSAYSPQVSGSGITAFAKPGTRVAAPAVGITDPTLLQRTAFGVSIEQYITDFGRTAELVRSYELAGKAEQERGKATRLTVLLNVTQAYFEVLRAQALVRVAEEAVGTRRTLFRQIDELQRAGLRSTLDVSVAQRDLSTAEQALIVARARRRDAAATLSDALGSPLDDDFALQDVRSLPSIPNDVGPLLDEMLRDNPTLGAMNEDVAAADARARAVARETSPTISAYGYAGGTPIRAANQAINAAYATAGVAMNVPIFDGGELAAARRQAEDAMEVDIANRDAERNDLYRDTRTAFDDVTASRSNVDATDQVVRTARTALALTRARYRIGLNSIVDLSEAELQMTQAQIDHENAIYDYVEQGAGLEFVTGVLAPAA